MVEDHAKTLPFRSRPGKPQADGFEIDFTSDNGLQTIGPELQLTAGSVGTWNLRIRVAAPVSVGGGFLFERLGFLLSHCVQNKAPRARDYVTMIAPPTARIRLELNRLNQGRWPPFARLVVESGVLAQGDEILLRIGDVQHGGPGSEIYDVICHGRIIASVDRTGSLEYWRLAQGEARVYVNSDPEPRLLRVLGPSVERTGEPFDLHVAVYDRYHNVCTQYTGSVEFHVDGVEIEGLPNELSFSRDDAGIKIIPGVTVASPNVVRIEARDDIHGLASLSNPLRVQNDMESLLLWGDLHSHSWGDISMGLMDEPTPILHPDSRHSQARGHARLDFSAPGPMAPPDQDIRPGVWQAHQAAYQANDKPGHYVPFLAAEAHPPTGGDRNVIFREWSERHAPTFTSMENLVETYGSKSDVILEAHVGGSPADWDAFPMTHEPVVEVASGHGSTEWILQRALRHGHRPAVIASGDTHLPTLGAPIAAHHFRGRFQDWLNVRDAAFGCGPIAAVHAKAHTRGAIWDALRSRHTYATTGARIILDLRVGTAQAGSEITVNTQPTFTIMANACAPIERIDLIRNDRSLTSWQPEKLDVELTFTDETPLPESAYYVRLRQIDGEYGWSTPIWITCSHGTTDPHPRLPSWNEHEAIALTDVRPNDAEAFESALVEYLEIHENPALFKELTPIRIVDEVPGQAALFYGYLEPDHNPISIRWFFDFPMPRLRIDWGWRDFGTRDGG